MKKAFSWMLILCLIFSSGCSLLSSEKADNPVADESDNEEVKQAATDVEGMLREGPGKYAGDKYDEEKVKAELDKLPDNMTADEAYNHLVALLAEDYKPILKKLDAFDPTIKTNIKTPGGVNAPEGELPKQVNVEILLDASGSMAGQVSGGVKMDLAKDAIRDFVSKMPEGAQVALRVYGHKGSNQQKDKKLSCKSTELVYPLGEYDKSSFQKSLDKFRPTGWTPLAAAIEQAKSDLSGKTGENVENIIYVVSDGIETCGGDPVKAAQELHQSEIQAIVNIIGFDVDNAGQQALKKVAEAGGGKYTTVSTGEDLRGYLEGEYDRLWLEWTNWGNESWLDAHQQELDNWDKMYDLITEIDERNLREKNNLDEASLYLNSKEKLQDFSALSRKISQRFLLINDYRNKRYNELNDLIEKEGAKEKQRIEEKEREMQEKYDR